MNKLSLDAIRLEQSGQELYVFKISGKKLLELSYVDRRAESKSGIQRMLKTSRTKKIGKFIDSDDGMFPNSIIVNIEGKADFRPDSKNAEQGTLEIEDKEHSMWIVDGQHRVNGFSHSEKDFDVIVTGLVNADTSKCAAIFYKINKEAKKVNPSLAYDLLGLLEEGFENPRDFDLHKVAKQLNSSQNGPFYNKIIMVDQGEGNVSQAALITKLKWFLKDKIGSRFEVDDRVEIDALIKLIETYFEVIRDLQSEAWENEENNYILSKGLGIGSMIYLLPDVILESKMRNNGTVDKHTITKILDPLKEVDFSTEGKQFAGLQGEQGMKEIKKILVDTLGIATLNKEKDNLF